MQNNEVEQILRYFYEKRELDKMPGSYTYLAKTRDICIIELLFAIGIRVAELYDLLCSDIDFENGSIKVNGKGSKERIIQICSSEVLRILKEYYIYAEPQTYFFINRFGNRISEQSVRLLLKRCVKELQLTKKITPHSFRHIINSYILKMTNLQDLFFRQVTFRNEYTSSNHLLLHKIKEHLFHNQR